MSLAPRRRWSFFLISALGLAIGLWGMKGLSQLSAFPLGFHPETIQYPARVGRAVVASPADLRFIAQSRPVGSILEILSDAGVARVHLEAQLTKLHYGIVFIEGLIFFAVNFLVFCPRVDRGPVRDLYWCTLLYGIAIMVGGAYFPRTLGWHQSILPLVWITCLTFLPVFFFRMALTFPRRRNFLEKRPGVMRALWITAAILVLWQTVAVLRYFADPRPALWQGFAFPRSMAEAFLVSMVGLGCLALYRSGRKLELSREREQAKWLLWGFAIGVTPYVFLRTLPRLAGLESPLPPELDRLFELAIPLAFTFAVVRYRFLDIDIIIRRSLIYGILAGVLASIYLLFGVLAGQMLMARFPRYAGAIQIFAVAIPVILYTPTRRWIGLWVDRIFFKIQYNYAQALVAFQEAVRVASSQEEIADLTQRFIKGELRLQRAAVLARRGEALEAAGDMEPSAEEVLAAEEALTTSGSPANPRRLLASPNSTSRPDLEALEFPEVFADAGVRLALPLAADGKNRGMILVGEKTSERRFIEEDLKLLYAVRAEAAAALERVELVQIATAETLERERAQELERMKSDFFSRVAHDLRTPLTSIRWTVQNLLDGVGGRPDPEHVPHLQAVDAAANQLGRLVNNLLELTRLEHPGARADLGPVDLVPLVQEAVGALRSATGERNVQFELSVAPGLRSVCGDRDQLSEVVTNLLENAARYSPNGAAVEITLDRGGDGQMLIVRDHGPGLSPHECERIFERFEQGRPSPYSRQRGFGLGLYVARSYLTLMRGSISAGNHPEGGARFVCLLPEWQEK